MPRFQGEVIEEFPDERGALGEEEIPIGGRFGGASVATESTAAADITSSIAQGFNIGLAKGAGFMVDATTGLLNLLPGVDIERPVGGSEQLRELFTEYGLTPPAGEKPPSPIVGRITEEIGAAAVPFGAVGMAARTGAKGGAITAPMLEAFRQAPKTTAAGELSAATGAGAGAAIAQQIAPDEPMAELAGQLIGGFAAPTAIAADIARSKKPSKGIKRVIEPLLPGGAERAAAKQLANIVDDPEQAIKILSQPQKAVPGAKLTPAQEIGDVGLLRLEQAIKKVKPELGDITEGARAITEKAIRAEAEDIAGPPTDMMRDFVESRMEEISGVIDDRIKKAVNSAQLDINNATPDTPREQLNIIARTHLDDAFQEAKLVERSAWDQVPDDIPADTAELKQAYTSIRGSIPKAQAEDIPDIARRMLGGKTPELEDVEGLKEIQGLRSKLLAISRNARSGDTPNFNKARIADELADVALSTMERSGAGEQVGNALAVTKSIKERFHQGIVGRVMGLERRGGPSVQPQQTLERLITKEGVEGGINIDSLMRATGNPKTRQISEDFMRHRFIMAATDNEGRVTPGSAKRFLAKNKEIFDRMPELKKELEQTKSSQELSERIQSALTLRKRSLMDKRKSRAALYIDAPIGKEIRRVINSKNPVGNMKELVRQAKRDSTGGALRGLKAQFIDEMLTQATKRKGLSADIMEEFVDKNQKIINRSFLFSKPEIVRLQNIVDTAKKSQGILTGGRRIDEILEESPDSFTDLVARIVGANLGASGAASTTGAPLVAAGAGSRYVRNLTNKLPFEKTRDILAEAVINRTAMRDLLRKVEAPEEVDKITRRMNSWMINLFTEDEPDQQQGPLPQ